MRLGIILPTFRESPDAALACAEEAEAAGLDGVFAYDHLWPMGSPERPALAPFEVLATVAVRHPHLVVGPLVARVGLVADGVLVSQLRALRTVAEGRLIAALGTGDSKSHDENLAYGLDVASPEARRASLEAIARALAGEGTEVWVGGGAPATIDIASRVGCTVNLWDASPEAVALRRSVTPVSWAGPMPARDGAVDLAAGSELAAGLERSGASWAVFGVPTSVSAVASLRAGTHRTVPGQG